MVIPLPTEFSEEPFIGTMTCLSNLNHLSGDMQSSLSRFLDHPSRSKLRGIHLKINNNLFSMIAAHKSSKRKTKRCPWT